VTQPNDLRTRATSIFERLRGSGPNTSETQPEEDGQPATPGADLDHSRSEVVPEAVPHPGPPPEPAGATEVRPDSGHPTGTSGDTPATDSPASQMVADGMDRAGEPALGDQADLDGPEPIQAAGPSLDGESLANTSVANSSGANPSNDSGSDLHGDAPPAPGDLQYTGEGVATRAAVLGESPARDTFAAADPRAGGESGAEVASGAGGESGAEPASEDGRGPGTRAESSASSETVPGGSTDTGGMAATSASEAGADHNGPAAPATAVAPVDDRLSPGADGAGAAEAELPHIADLGETDVGDGGLTQSGLASNETQVAATATDPVTAEAGQSGPASDLDTGAFRIPPPPVPETVADISGTRHPSARNRPLPRTLAVANQKGGVGKTTTAVNLGAALAELDYRVLVVDLDPQGNATTGLGINARNLDSSIYDVILHDVPIEDVIEPTTLKNLFVVPATIDLAGAEIELVPVFSRELRLKKGLEPIIGDFDFVLIDCPPSLGLLTVNGLAAATEVAVPIQCEYYALEGLGQLLRNVGLVQTNLNGDLEVSTIILTMYDARTKLAEQVAQEVRQYFGDRVCRSVVPRTVRLSEAPSFGQPIIVFDPSSRGSIAYRELAKEVSGGAPKRTR
jgi:chromosome partitioning protein